MTSSNKHLFYLSQDALRTYLWHGGQLSAGPVFEADPAGIDAYGHYLARRHGAPVYLLVDLVEEEFQRQLLPHVGGRQRRRLLARRLDQAFRDTPFRHAEIQGRAPQGRRDDRALLCALTNPSTLAPWLAALEQHQLPLAGLYSVPLLSAQLLKRLRLAYPHLLLLSQQPGGLRQSFFHGSHLRFSRLMPGVDWFGSPERIAAETEKLRLFLDGAHLLDVETLLHVAILAPSDDATGLTAHYRDSADTHWQIIGLDSAAHRLGCRALPRGADQLLLHQLGADAPASHYALADQRRGFQHWRARRMLYGASALLLAAALAYAGASLEGALAAHRESALLSRTTGEDNARDRFALASLGPDDARPERMRAAVELDEMIERQMPRPTRVLEAISRALDAAPAVRLTALRWQASPNATAAGTAPSGVTAAPAPNAIAAAPMPSPMPSPMSSPMPSPMPAAIAPVPAPVLGIGANAQLLGIPAAPAQTVTLEGELADSTADERSASLAMERLVAQLAREPHLSVSVQQAPIDLRANAALSGNTPPGDAERHLHFALGLVWTP